MENRCCWEEVNADGIKCEKPATGAILFQGAQVPVCDEHGREWVKDHQQPRQ